MYHPAYNVWRRLPLNVCNFRQFSLTRGRACEVLPSIAPKPSIDIKHIRQYPELYSNNCLERNYKAQSDSPFKIVKLFDQWLRSQKNARGLRQKSNAIRTQLSHARTSSGAEVGSREGEGLGRQKLLEEAKALKENLSSIEAQEIQLTDEIVTLAAELPNLTSSETPRGSEPKIVGYINEYPKHAASPLGRQMPYDRTWRNHVHIGTELDLLDFAGAATTSGWGWYFLKNEAARLEHALVQYAIGIAMDYGFTEVTPPSMVYTHVGSACGFRPRDQSGEQQIYRIQQPDKDQGRDKPSHSLAATAEIPFASMMANQTIHGTNLPIKLVGSSRCYRAEAGGRGVETKGLYRVHEFTKVEMFAWTVPGGEAEAFNSMISIQTTILKNLGLHCRVLEMPTHDLGASARRKQDIEAYFPSRRDRDQGWGEVTSASICTDYQTRRLNTRMENLAGSEKRLGFPFTVNGTAMAVPRVLAAIIENGWDEEGFVRIPEALWPWMRGVQTIKRER